MDPPTGALGLSPVTEFGAGIVAEDEEDTCGMLGEAGPEGALAVATGGSWEVPGAEDACKPRLDPVRGSGDAWWELAGEAWREFVPVVVREAMEWIMRRLGDVGRLIREGGGSASPEAVEQP